MLVGGRMVDGMRAPGVHDLGHAMGRAHRGQQRHQFDVRGVLGAQGQQILVHLIERELAALHQQQAGAGSTNSDGLPVKARECVL